MENEARVPKITIEKNYIQLEYGELIGIADFQSNIVIPVKAYEWFIEEDDFIFVKEVDEDWEVYLIENKTVRKLEYDEVRYEEEEYVLMKIDGGWILCDLTYYLDESEEYFDEDLED